MNAKLNITLAMVAACAAAIELRDLKIGQKSLSLSLAQLEAEQCCCQVVPFCQPGCYNPCGDSEEALDDLDPEVRALIERLGIDIETYLEEQAYLHETDGVVPDPIIHCDEHVIPEADVDEELLPDPVPEDSDDAFSDDDLIVGDDEASWAPDTLDEDDSGEEAEVNYDEHGILMQVSGSYTNEAGDQSDHFFFDENGEKFLYYKQKLLELGVYQEIKNPS